MTESPTFGGVSLFRVPIIERPYSKRRVRYRSRLGPVVLSRILQDLGDDLYIALRPGSDAPVCLRVDTRNHAVYLAGGYLAPRDGKPTRTGTGGWKSGDYRPYDPPKFLGTLLELK